MYLIATAPGHSSIVERARAQLHALGLDIWAHLIGVGDARAAAFRPDKLVDSGGTWWLWHDRPYDDKVTPAAVAAVLHTVAEEKIP